ncbi:MAG TPA: hypothetical protein VFF79_01215 [Conexibacter sp.]|nr:hypothetical protein [Conexibacter sp.]
MLTGAVALLALLLTGQVLAFLYLAPALLLSAILALGCFPGERLLAARMTATARLRPERHIGRPHPPRILRARGGLLLATRLAGRAPPLTTTTPA